MTPDFIEITPIIKGKKCRFMLYCLYVFITFSPAFASLVIWYHYGFLVGFAFFLFFTLGMGIIISKLRVASIPPAQREMSYSNMAIARWFLSENVCF
jgi:hypothetical protein